MKNEPLKLRELLWRRKLTEAERTEWRAQPEVSAELEIESRLSELLAQIPNANVPSNFTARALQAATLEDAKDARARKWKWNWHALLPRTTVAAVLMGFAGFTLYHHEIYSQRAALAQSVARVAEAQPLPSVDALKNFDAIQRMSQPARADDELLALLQ